MVKTNLLALSFVFFNLNTNPVQAADGTPFGSDIETAQDNMAAGICSLKMPNNFQKTKSTDYDDCMKIERPKARVATWHEIKAWVKQTRDQTSKTTKKITENDYSCTKTDTTINCNRAQTYCWGADSLRTCMTGQLVLIDTITAECTKSPNKDGKCINDRLDIANFCINADASCPETQMELIKKARAEANADSKCPPKNKETCFRSRLRDLRKAPVNANVILNKINKPLTEPTCKICESNRTH